MGGKDGTYYVIDRDGVNEVNGVAWNDADPKQLPYWKTQVVPGGDIGGIIASAAVDEERRRIFFSTAPGLDVFHPQRPTVHALDMDTGAVVWNNGTSGAFSDASYAPTSAIPGVVFTGAVLSTSLRLWNADDGALLYNKIIASPAVANAIAGAATVVDGTVLVPTGIGTRSGDPHDLGDSISREPRSLVALCVPGTRGCGACQNGIDDDRDNLADWPDDPGCASPEDDSEKSDAIACDDGIDNDGDGKIDMIDAGCPFPAADRRGHAVRRSSRQRRQWRDRLRRPELLEKLAVLGDRAVLRTRRGARDRDPAAGMVAPSDVRLSRGPAARRPRRRRRDGRIPLLPRPGSAQPRRARAG